MISGVFFGTAMLRREIPSFPKEFILIFKIQSCFSEWLDYKITAGTKFILGIFIINLTFACLQVLLPIPT
jgi:hypothetical protein